MRRPMLKLFKGPAEGQTVPQITPAEATSLLASGGALLVDVREPAEVAASGKLAGARVVPLGALPACADPAGPDHDPAFRTDQAVILYCATGDRSNLAGQALLRLGYLKVHNLGGIAACAASGMAVERD